MLADFDAIGAVAIVVIGLVSYIADYMKKQKAEAAERRRLQEEFRQRAQARKYRVDEAARQAQRLEEQLRREAQEQRPVASAPRAPQLPPRPRVAPAQVRGAQPQSAARPARTAAPIPEAKPVSASLEESLPDFEVTMPDLETSMPDAEEAAQRRMERRAADARQPLSPSAAAAVEMGSVSASLNDAEQAALAALRSGSRTSAAWQKPRAARSASLAPFPGKLDAATIRQAVIYQELLDRPVALRGGSWR